jgi:hypothetical protein
MVMAMQRDQSFDRLRTVPGGSAMLFEDNFVRVNDRRIADPVLKIAIQQGRFHPDGNFYALGVYYDPDMRADHLLVKMSDEEKKSYGVGPGPQGDTMAYRSEKERHIVNLGAFIRYDGAAGELAVICRENELQLSVPIIQRENLEGISDNPVEFCLYLLRSLIRLGTWDASAKLWRGSPGSGQEITKISFLLPNALAGQIRGITGESFDRYSDTHMLLAQREVLR